MTKHARYDFKTRHTAHPDAIVAGDKYRFTILTDGLLRFEWAADGKFEDRASTFAVDRRLAVPDFYVWDRGHGIEIVTKRFHVVYNKKKFSADGFKIHLKGAVTGTWAYGERLSNLGGTTRTLDGVNGRTGLGHGVLSRKGIAVINDSKSMLFDDNGWIAGRQKGDRSDEYIFMYGRDYREAVRAYYAVSGSQPLLPRYAMGNWWSRYHRYDEKEYLELHDHFDKDDVPMNVAVVDMDWHLVWNLGCDGWTGYTWNKRLFPDPDKFMQKLHDRGMKLTLNLHPHLGFRAHEAQYPEVAKYMGIDPKTKKTVHFDCTDKRFMDAYFDIVHHQHEDRGVDFWWIDWQQGNTSKVPGVDPLWVLNHFHFLDSARGSQRPLILSRFGGPGAQRYQIGFSGDAIITWESLHFQPEFTATASNIGYGWWSNDIGGHTHGYKDDELYTRWVHLGCYAPILRLHSDNNPFNTREPWRHTEEACRIVEDTLRFRHRLIPYLYTMNARSASDDEPLVQPMYWDYPEEEDAYHVPNQYRFGSELIVIPITQPRDQITHLGAAKAWLPAGKFVDLFTGIVYNRKGQLRLHRPLSQTPVLLPEGSIVPLDGAWRPQSGSPNPSSFELVVVVGKDASFTLIEDDGTGTNVEDGGFSIVDANDIEPIDKKNDNNSDPDPTVTFITTPITYKHATGVLQIGPISHPGDASIPHTRTWTIKLLGCTLPGVTDSSRLTCLSLGPNTSRRAKVLAHKISDSPTGSVITLDPMPTDHAIIIELGSSGGNTSTPIPSDTPDSTTKPPTLNPHNPTPHLWNIIDKASIYMDLKWELWNVLGSSRSVPWKARALKGMGLRNALLDALLEILLADGEGKKKRDGKGKEEGEGEYDSEEEEDDEETHDMTAKREPNNDDSDIAHVDRGLTGLAI